LSDKNCKNLRFNAASVMVVPTPADIP
jgi:hypothetical protein